MPEPEPVYLIDGSAYIYRAFHAITSLTNSSGLPTNAVYGFINILLRVIREKKPGLLAIAFDARGPNFRHDLYPAYKANRPSMPDDLIPQIPYIKKLVAAHRILSLEQEGVEADDLIAAATGTLTRAGRRVVIVSGDKDLLQLVSADVTFWEPMNDKVMDIAAVQKKYNVAPERLLDLFALMGDKSDNIPGVPGVGPKTAGQLINEFGSLEGVYDNLASISKKKLKENLANHRNDAFLSRDLIRLKTDIDVPARPEDYRLPDPDRDLLKDIYVELEFTRLLKEEVPAAGVRHETFRMVSTGEDLRQLADRLQDSPHLVIDTETTSLDPLLAELVGISLCTGTDQAFYIPIGHCREDGTLRRVQPDRDSVLAALRPLLEDSRIAKIGHNLKFDYSILAQQGIQLAGPLWDSMLASYLLNPSRRTHKLDDLSIELLDLKPVSFAEVTGKDKREDSFAYVSPEDAKNYSCEDVYLALLLWEKFRPQLVDLHLWPLYENIEEPLISILADMELAGIEMDGDLLRDMSGEFGSQLAGLEQEIFRLAGGEFNINSPPQLGEILFERLGLPHGRKTKTGYSTDVGVLEKLAPLHDLPRLVIAHRNLSKLKSTYADKLAGLIHPVTGRVHTSFNQTVTATGRLSSSNPNLQNIPIRTPEGQRIRQAFIPARGHLFLAGDYSQIDLRVLAHYSQDSSLLEAFRANQDIHNRTAAEIYMISPLLITKEMRRVAKTINFGIVYGMSSFGLASQLDLSRRAAQTFIDRYFEHYRGVRQFMDDIIEQARRDGYVTTLLNRRRLLPEIRSSNRNRREFAERTAINTPIQGTAADIIKLAMIRCAIELKNKGLAAKMLLQIHDELVFEVPVDEVDRTREVVREAMESVITLDVPLVVNLEVGENLATV